MRVPFADLTRLHQPLRRDIEAAIEKILDENSYIMGSEVAAFEADFARFCGVRHAIGVANGTDALVVALKALGVGAGDEVITVPNTFIATSEAVTQTGASVRFVDVDPRTSTIDPNRLADAITPRTRALIPVHLYGQAANMDAVGEIAKRHSLFVIEDAAQAHGATWAGRPVGSFGDCATFSFYPGKNLGAIGDAGAIVTQRDDLAEKLRALRDHGRAPGSKYGHAMEGFNARMDTIQAAVLRVKLAHLARWNVSRQQAARRYAELLAGIDGVVLPAIAAPATHVFHLYVVQAARRDRLQDFLKANGVSTGIHYPIPLHLQPAYAHLGLRKGSFPVTEALAARILSLPMFADMTEPEQAWVAEQIKAFQRAPIHA
jgi:dTDP-4-amino-4,6-dideoxygalactose transaminase